VRLTSLIEGRAGIGCTDPLIELVIPGNDSSAQCFGMGMTQFDSAGGRGRGVRPHAASRHLDTSTTAVASVTTVSLMTGVVAEVRMLAPAITTTALDLMCWRSEPP
jgi:hypothetical protein